MKSLMFPCGRPSFFQQVGKEREKETAEIRGKKGVREAKARSITHTQTTIMAKVRKRES